MNFFREKKALILTETLLTLSILAASAIIAGSIFTSASTTTMLSKDFLIANGLAIEGTEAVKNIIYTNKMIMPTDKTCWLTLDPATNCSPSAAVGSNYLPFEKDNGSQTKGKWKLGDGALKDLDLEKGAGANTTYLLYINNDTKRYTTSPTNAVPSKFYRSVKFLGIADDDSSATFESKVAWFEGAKAWETVSIVDIVNR
jgi:hypothetical protein